MARERVVLYSRSCIVQPQLYCTATEFMLPSTILQKLLPKWPATGGVCIYVDIIVKVQ